MGKIPPADADGICYSDFCPIQIGETQLGSRDELAITDCRGNLQYCPGIYFLA
jgi:hypothetical protein